MEINVHSLHFNADSKLLDFINVKVGKLETFYDGIVAADVTLKLEKSDKTENKVAEIKVSIPGNDAFASNRAKTFEEAVDLTVDALKGQLKKAKEKQKGL
ncbi:MAG: ribosome-associated translation inhibitor RaiA [Salinivirgaceae bacterium]|nr:ribosome-associated translation inhibitor RaiA [Salinivirgaceae bacterium]